MSKTGDTKNRILDLLSRRRMTLTDISKELGLAPSTVNQHIQELLRVNAIHQVDNPFIVKWKYYEANPEFMKATATSGLGVDRTLGSPMFRAIGAIAIVAVLAGLAGYWLFGTSGAVPQTTGSVQQELGAGTVPAGVTVFSLSDAPGVSTISALNISVSGAMIHSTSTGKWYTVFSSNTPKTFDLVALRNTSQLLSGANLSGGMYDEIVLEVANASAVVNGNTQTVFLPSGDLRIFGKFNVSGASNSSNSMGGNSSGSNWVNIDFNLNRSVHITGDGKVILLPVINLLAESGANLSVGANSMIQKVREGRIELKEVESMDVGGNMTSNSVSVGQDEQLGVESGFHMGPSFISRVLIVNTSQTRGPIFIRTGHKLIVIANATDTSQLMQNLSANLIVTVVGAGSPPANETERIRCNSDEEAGSLSCFAEGNIDGGNVGNIIANDSGSLFGFGDGGHPHGMMVVNGNITIGGGRGGGSVNSGGRGNGGSGSGSASGSESGSETSNINVNVTGRFNGTLSNSNYPPWANASWQDCGSSDQCMIAPVTYCQNGAPQQSTCVNQNYQSQYMTAYNASVRGDPATPRFCPMYVLAVLKSCSCIQKTCTLVIGGGG